MQPPIDTHGAAGTTPAFSHYHFFSYTGGKQSFKVPAGVTHLTITAYGANGAWGESGYSGYAASGGPGGMVTAKIPVTPGEGLAIFVGGSGGHDGFNGGGGDVRGNRGSCDCNSGGGCNGAAGLLGAGGVGGGGQNCGGAGGGGGGGSSYAEARAAHVKMTRGENPTSHGDGSVIIFW
jgi:hypothetical protein